MCRCDADTCFCLLLVKTNVNACIARRVMNQMNWVDGIIHVMPTHPFFGQFQGEVHMN